MPRRKNVDKTSAEVKNKEKTPKKRVKKEKPVLKTPTTINIKIPFAKSSLKPSSSCEEKQKTLKEIRAGIKIDLANEVALAALAKTTPESRPAEEKTTLSKKSTVKKSVNKPVNTAIVKTAKKKAPTVKKSYAVNDTDISDISNEHNLVKPTVKKRGRPKKENGKTDGNVSANLEINIKEPIKKRKKVVAIKMNEDVNVETEAVPIAPSKTKADSTSKIVKPSPKKRKLTSSSPILKFPSKRVTRQRNYIDTSGKVTSKDAIFCSNKSPSILGQSVNRVPSLDEYIKTNDQHPGLVESRKTSMNSVSECQSWTKDISSSSTTTCITVHSNDFVRIDKKFPILKLKTIDKELERYTSGVDSNQVIDSDSDDNTTSDSDSSSSDSSSSNSSLSSLSQAKSTTPLRDKSFQSTNTIEDYSKAVYALDKLASKATKFDLEIMNWIGYNDETSEVNDKIFENSNILAILKEENKMLKDCRELKEILVDETDYLPENRLKVPSSNNLGLSDDDNDKFISSQSKYVMLDQNANNECLKEVECKESIEDYNSGRDKFHYSTFDYSGDNVERDDDVLSLDAESITGIESSRYSSLSSMRVATDFEEYVPQPVSTVTSEKVNYCPTKITDSEQVQNQKYRTVCEKQSADSTSISKETERYEKIQLDINKTNVEKLADEPQFPPPVLSKPKLCLMSIHNKAVGAVKSAVFRGVCFFNLISNCKKKSCLFPHVSLDAKEVENRLKMLNDDNFIREYMLMRSWPGLRRQYFVCFTEECQRRQLTRILVEMAIDSIMKAKIASSEDAALKVNVSEQVLLYLNKVNLSTCEDLLNFNITPGKNLCDIFMETIAETQNFSRFKLVFLKMTDFIVKHKRNFTLDVATHILERVCILPYEKPLARALLTIMEHTDECIFENSMIRQLKLERELFDIFLELKEKAKKLGHDNVGVSSPCMPQVLDHSFGHLNQERYTSPDTTKLDNMATSVAQLKVSLPPVPRVPGLCPGWREYLYDECSISFRNKTVEEPIITRTIGLHRVQSFPLHSSKSNSPLSNGSMEDSRLGKQARSIGARNWRGNHFSPRFPQRPMFRQQMRPFHSRGQHHQLMHRPPRFRRQSPDLFY